MKEKSKIEKNAEERQISLLSTALGEASKANGYWLNASGKRYPRLYPHGVSASPFNALFMALHSDRNGCNTNLFTLFSDAKARGTSVREHEQGVPFLYYNWNKYVHRNNPEEFIDRGTYLTLDDEQKKQYKGVHNREIRTLFNIDQTTFPHVDEEAYKAVLQLDGNAMERGFSEADTRRMHIRFNDFLLKMRDGLVPVRYDGSGMPHYETDRDAVYMPRQKSFDHYNDYVQETLRQIVSATGHQQRLAREGMVMKNGMPPSDDAVKQERLVVEIASGIKMLELGLPARLSDESLRMVEYWERELKENPNLIDALESDVNNALEVIRKAERGEKIEYATLRNRKQTSDMREQLPKHYFVGDDLLPADIARYADDIRPVAMGVLSAAEMGRFLGKMADTLPDGTFLRGHALLRGLLCIAPFRHRAVHPGGKPDRNHGQRADNGGLPAEQFLLRRLSDGGKHCSLEMSEPCT